MSDNNIKNQNIEFSRGLAVLIVFFFHYNPQIFSSFFVGVDIFFLVSGYVITLSIFKKKKFEISSYYLRRIKRIYPNLIFILLFFGIIYFFFYNEYYKDFNTNFFSIIFSFLGISNLYYSLNPNLFYFDQEIRWLIHTWSLSVEIQFYIIFGLICLLYFRYFKKNDHQRILFKLILIFIFIISITLFFFSELKFISDYYSLPSRLWEFALGSIIYFFHFKKKLNFNFLILIFLFILSVSNLFISNEEVIIFFSVIYFFLVLSFSQDLKNNFITKIFRFFGRISYSYYLWHLVFISFLKSSFDFFILDFMFIFSITTIFSFLTYQLIEIRFNQAFKIDVFLKKIILSLCILVPFISIYVFLFNLNLINKSFNSLNKHSINFFHFVERNSYFVNTDNVIIQERYDQCENEFEIFNFSKKVNCIKYQPNSSLVYLMGNSYADHIIPPISEVFSKSTIYNARFENCYVSSDLKCERNKLNVIISQYLKISSNFKKKIIIFSLNNKSFSKIKMLNILNKVKDENTKIFIIYPHPSTKVFSNQAELKNYNLIKNNDFKILKNDFDLNIYDTFKNICSDCDLETYKNFFIEDGSHFNLKGSLNLVNSLKDLSKL